MRSYNSETLAILTGRKGIIARRFVWIQARNIATDQIESLGLWSGEDHVSVTIDGEARTYIGAGTLLQTEPLSASAGLGVRIHQLSMAAIAPEVEDLVKGYDTRFAPVMIHRGLYDPQTRQLAGAPHRVFKGIINGIKFPRAAPGENATCTIEIASATRVLTRTLAAKKSDDSQKRRGGDRFRRYGDISGAVPVYWGELRISAPADPAPAGNSGKEPEVNEHGFTIYKGR